MNNRVYAISLDRYDPELIYRLLPDRLFRSVNRGQTVILKPNWVLESHQFRREEWEYVITHPAVITAVVRKVLDRLSGGGTIVILDAPTTEACFGRLLSRYPVDEWKALASGSNVALEVIDLRDQEFVTRNGIVIKRVSLPGDPRGKVLVNLPQESSEFRGHTKSRSGYYGADYDRSETNAAHNGRDNLYSVSKTVIEGDVFINLPKLKTHGKAGITSCLKNLVGINTYKNYLPHHCEGDPSEGGDQFPGQSFRAEIEGPLMRFLKQHVLTNHVFANMLSPFKAVGAKFFGDTREVVRSGNWYGNDTVWRMILDLNKILFYADSDGNMRSAGFAGAKRYIGIVDGIVAGEGKGPLVPDPVGMGYLFCGASPVAIDAVCAEFMGFDARKIPSIAKAFQVAHYPLCDFPMEAVEVETEAGCYSLTKLPRHLTRVFEPHFGWKGHIEKEAQ
ncbi:MAG: DUF362 domain-containing protein [Syntrophobacteraceae bacterium]